MPLIQEIFTHYGGLSYKKYQKSMPPLHKKALVAIMNYRTKSLGGEVYYCSKCNEYHYSYSRVLGIKAGIGTVIATMIPYSIVFFHYVDDIIGDLDSTWPATGTWRRSLL